MFNDADDYLDYLVSFISPTFRVKPPHSLIVIQNNQMDVKTTNGKCFRVTVQEILPGNLGCFQAD